MSAPSTARQLTETAAIAEGQSMSAFIRAISKVRASQASDLYKNRELYCTQLM
jgi:hypothetical protein